MSTTRSTQSQTPDRAALESGADDDLPLGALAQAELPVAAASVALISGRRIELRASSEGDEVVVRAVGGGEVVRIEITDAGAVVRATGAPVELRASGRLTLSADDLELCAKRNLHLSAGKTISLDASCLTLASEGAASLRTGGDLTTRTAGTHHLVAQGAVRMEAAAVELQANEQAVRVRAMEGVELDAEHIGLNDDPCPAPFPWSSIAIPEPARPATVPDRRALPAALASSPRCATERAALCEEARRSGHD